MIESISAPKSLPSGPVVLLGKVKGPINVSHIIQQYHQAAQDLMPIENLNW
ncbi:MAG: hypothetical protein H7296_10790 [Bacteroidia bacterium]|nr:hypothetical protein [Bacteroidia bacterium]